MQEVRQVGAVALGRGRGDEAGRFIDHHQILVQMDDAGRGQRRGVALARSATDGLGGALEGAAGVGFYGLSGAQETSGDLHPSAIHEDAANVDEYPRLLARQPGDAGGQDLIEPPAFVLGQDGEAVALGGGRRHAPTLADGASEINLRSRCGRALVVTVDPTFLHDEEHLLHEPDVARGVAWHGDDVGQLARTEGAETVTEAEELGID